jgi:hypothetical protein
MTYYNNLAAVYYEKKDNEKCIETCKKAIEVGREARADYKIVAKSFARMGNAYKVRARRGRMARGGRDVCAAVVRRRRRTRRGWQATQMARGSAA